MTREDILRKALVDQLTTQNPDMRGRRVVNASPSAAPTDYTIRKELDTEVSKLVSIDSLQTRIVNFFKSYTGKIITNALWTFNKLVSFVNGIQLSLIYPISDGISAIHITKADGTTDIIIVDSTDNFTRFTGSARFESNTNSSTGAGTEIGYWAGHYCYLQGYDRSGSAFLETRIDGDPVRIGYSGASHPVYIGGTLGSIGFFGSTPATKQTLASYTANNRSASFTSTPASLATAATLTDLNTLRTAYENLRISYEDLRTKLQTTTLVG